MPPERKESTNEKDTRGSTLEFYKDINSCNNDLITSRPISIPFNEFLSKLAVFVEHKNEEQGVELFKMCNNLPLKKEIIAVLEGITRYENMNSRLTLSRLSELLSALALVACSQNLNQLVATENFTLNHFKKCLSYYNQIFFIIQKEIFSEFSDLISCSLISIFEPLTTLFLKAPKLKYENEQFLLKLLGLLTCICLNTTSKYREIYVCLEKNKLAFDDFVTDKEKEETDHTPGITLVYKKFKNVNSKPTLIELADSVFQFPVTGFIRKIIDGLNVIVSSLEGSLTNSLASLNALLLFKESGNFQRELLGLILIKQSNFINNTDKLETSNFFGAQATKLLKFGADFSWDKQIEESLVFKKYLNIYQQKLLNEQKFPDFAFEVFYEIIDHNFKICLNEKTFIVQLIKGSLEVISSRVKTNEDYLILHQKAQASTLSLISVMSYLNYIMVSNVLKSDTFTREVCINLPKSFDDTFNFSTISPLAESDFISEGPSTKEVMPDDGNIFPLFEIIYKASEIQESVIQHLAFYMGGKSGDTDTDRNWSSLTFKFLNKHIDLIVSSVLSSSILIQNCKIIASYEGTEERALSDIIYLSDQLEATNLSLLSGLIRIHGGFGAYCILKNFNNICLGDLKLVQICSSFLVKLIEDKQLREFILVEKVCCEVFNQFLDLFDDPSLSSFNELFKEFPDKPRTEQIYSINSSEYRSLSKRQGSDDVEGSSTFPYLPSPKNIYADMNINRIPNFSLFHEKSQQEILTISSQTLHQNLRSSLQSEGDHFVATNFLGLADFSKKSASSTSQPSSGSDEFSKIDSSFSTSYSPSASGRGNYDNLAQSYNFQSSQLNTADAQSTYNLNGFFEGRQSRRSLPGVSTTISPQFQLPNQTNIKGINQEIFKPFPLNGPLDHMYREGFPGNNSMSRGLNHSMPNSQLLPQLPNTSRSQSIHVDEFDKKN